jgi:hypothetical protein
MKLGWIVHLIRRLPTELPDSRIGTWVLVDWHRISGIQLTGTD